MKRILLIASGLVLGSAAFVMGQNAASTNTGSMGRGRGGAPYAWNDKNKDGICDVTGNAVGQNRGNGAVRGGRRGLGAANGLGRGMGRGFGFRRQANPAQSQK